MADQSMFYNTKNPEGRVGKIVVVKPITRSYYEFDEDGLKPLELNADNGWKEDWLNITVSNPDQPCSHAFSFEASYLITSEDNFSYNLRIANGCSASEDYVLLIGEVETEIALLDPQSRNDLLSHSGETSGLKNGQKLLKLFPLDVFTVGIRSYRVVKESDGKLHVMSLI